jgi:hypothetical protein
VLKNIDISRNVWFFVKQIILNCEMFFSFYVTMLLGLSVLINSSHTILIYQYISYPSTFCKGLGAIGAKIGPTSDVDKIFSKMYS